MLMYVNFFQGAVIFFIVGVWTSYLDVLFQDEFTDNDNNKRGFWTTVALTVIAISVLIFVHYTLVAPQLHKNNKQKQFLNIPQDESDNPEAAIGQRASELGTFEVGV